tara:strand:+ start:8459 stop:8632 length:174 start_codon:yes stop_codon:yes gene_type:complete
MTDSEEIFYYLEIDEGAIIVSEILERPKSLDVGCYIDFCSKPSTLKAPPNRRLSFPL